MSLKNTSNSNVDGNEDAERSGGSVGTSNDSFRWARPLLLEDNSDSSTSINSAATLSSNTEIKGIVYIVTITIVAHHHPSPNSHMSMIRFRQRSNRRSINTQRWYFSNIHRSCFIAPLSQ